MSVARSSIDQVIDLVNADGGPPLVVVTGRTGTGRSTVLAEIGRFLQARGRVVIDTRIARDGVPVDRRDGGTTPGPAGWSAPLTPVDGAFDDRSTARRAATAMAASVVPREAVVLVDDAQWMDRDTAAVLEALAHRVAGTAVRYVCAVALPCPEPLRSAGVAALRRLRAERLVATVRVPALDLDATALAVRAHVGALPSPELVAHVRARSRGIAAAVVDVVSSVRDSGGVRLVSGHAYLVPDAPDDLADGSAPPLRGVSLISPAAWRTACTAAALEPAGPVLPALLATTLETTVDEALARLRDLEAAGLLHRARDGSRRFLVPFLASRLRAELRPYERRRLAALVVRAAWQGEVALSRPALADLIAVAGRLLPAARAHADLVAAAQETRREATPCRDARWWRAAAELAGSEDDRVRAWLEHCKAGKRAGDAPATIASARKLLDSGSALPEVVRHELYMVLVLALHANGDTEELDAVANGTAFWEADEAVRAICRVLALILRGSWGAAYSLLLRARPIWAARPATRERGELIQWVGELVAGRMDEFEAGLVVSPVTDGEGMRRRYPTDWAIACMVALGDVQRGREIARTAGLAESDLLPTHRAVFALAEGRPEAQEMARRSLADRGRHHFELGDPNFYQQFGSLALAKGELGATRQLIATARAEMHALDHVLDVLDATIEATLGEVDTGRARLEGALDRARDNGVVVGTELLLSMLVRLHLLAGDVPGAKARVQDLDAVADVLRSPRAWIHATSGRALAHGDTAAAAECLRLARETGQAFDEASLGLQLAWAGLAEPEVLVDVYAFYGRLDAPLARAWTRSAMAARGVPVPGRAVTKAENERLLGQLLTEGLTNRQIASLLGSSEKSVEGRLGRLFSRTGYRSRIELAAALLDGSYRH
ncbi:AAA family ATPase [Pseudonocardia sp. MH-G8]|uniref:AAA family ATPase n=1 Tax=Pseudonocardia sp. MH-G8 TaxID=1854588 RepID=UPI00117A1E8D|nr:AAA family ATPase [Pseudonocardia sp. MH-G8]